MEYLRCAQLAGERAHGWDWDGIFKYEIQIWTRSVDEMLYTMARILTKKW